jgi:hypothetical protein
MPVLSEQMSVTAPNASSDFRLRTTQTGGHCVDDDLLLVGKSICGEHDDRTNHCDTKQKDSKAREFLLQRRADINTKESANRVRGCKTPGLCVAVRASFALVVALDGAYLVSSQQMI